MFESCRARGWFLLIAIVSFVLPAAGVQAQWSANPAANLQVADSAGDQIQSKVRDVSDGSSYISWFDGAAGYDVRLQRLLADGSEAWTHNGILVADRSVGSTEDYGLAVDASNNAVLAYGLVNFSSIQAQKVNSAGALQWGGGVTINTPGGGHGPRVAVTSDSYYIVAWTEGTTIVMQKLDSSGAAQWGAGIVISEVSRQLFLSDLQPGDNGSVIALWMRCGSTNCITSNKHLYSQKYDASGVALWNGGSPRIIFDGTSIQNGYFPTFLPDGSGGAVYGWYETGGSRNSYVQHVDSSGTELFPHNGVASTGATPGLIRISASVGYDRVADEAFLSWIESSSPTQNMWGVRAQRFSSAGARMWTDSGAVLSAIDANQEGFDRTIAYGGGCISHWFEDTGGGTAVIKSARLDSAGAHVWAGSPIFASSRATGKSRLDVAGDACGMSKLVWSDGSSGGSQDVLAQNVRRNGTLGPLVPGPLGDMNCDGAVNDLEIAPAKPVRC